ncbi:hypothetical protein CDAR_112521 [Caerostris darwini]|uniref:Prolactin receptor n=1 Tax=Caerostris darwini TaxID=1538125 RepID=A0AAV4PZU0_9ARAC|nr:hypothetical protein CDAR_112521 [Caerostris darwini]
MTQEDSPRFIGHPAVSSARGHRDVGSASCISNEWAEEDTPSNRTHDRLGPAPSLGGDSPKLAVRTCLGDKEKSSHPPTPLSPFLVKIPKKEVVGRYPLRHPEISVSIEQMSTQSGWPNQCQISYACVLDCHLRAKEISL